MSQDSVIYNLDNLFNENIENVEDSTLTECNSENYAYDNIPYTYPDVENEMISSFLEHTNDIVCIII